MTEASSIFKLNLYTLSGSSGDKRLDKVFWRSVDINFEFNNPSNKSKETKSKKIESKGNCNCLVT